MNESKKDETSPIVSTNNTSTIKPRIWWALGISVIFFILTLLAIFYAFLGFGFMTEGVGISGVSDFFDGGFQYLFLIPLVLGILSYFFFIFSCRKFKINLFQFLLLIITLIIFLLSLISAFFSSGY